MSESIQSDPITLTRFLLQERQQFKSATGNFVMLLQSIQLACKVIAKAVNKAGIANLYGMSGSSNESGDSQKKLDILSNEIFINTLSYSKAAYILCSEENKESVVLEEKKGGYAVVFDPLDGSSNIDCNGAIGSIFGVYRKATSDSTAPSDKDLLRPGRDLIAAGYALYGAACMIVLTTGLGVNGFTLDPTIGEFILTHRNIRIPRSGKYYSINEGNSDRFDKPTLEYLKLCKRQKRGLRYVGSMVADVHRTLLYGGIFCYPGDKKNKKGKLRLLYECNPMAMIMEQAGGLATTGHQRVLNVLPGSLHARSPIFCGSSQMVQEIGELYAKYDAPKARL